MGVQVFWSGGAGDLIACESAFTDEYRKSVTRMYWATRVKPQMSPLFTRLPSFPNLVDHVSLWSTFDKEIFSFKDFNHAYNQSLHQHLVTGAVDDWSIIKRFNNPMDFTYSSFVKYKLASIEKFKLPEQYVVVCPYSSVTEPSVQVWRRFFDKDWDWLFEHLKTLNMPGVVLNVGNDIIPDNDCLINLANKTTMAEAMEIVKKAYSMVTIDSGLSILGCRVFPADRIIISTLNAVFWMYKHVYCAPHKQFDFIVPFLGATQENREAWIAESERINPLLLDNY
jgi:hypothetical protein